jgi:hypothetical protein
MPWIALLRARHPKFAMHFALRFVECLVYSLRSVLIWQDPEGGSNLETTLSVIACTAGGLND